MMQLLLLFIFFYGRQGVPAKKQESWKETVEPMSPSTPNLFFHQTLVLFIH
jgi:hypothetical protein